MSDCEEIEEQLNKPDYITVIASVTGDVQGCENTEYGRLRGFYRRKTA